ncbi:MAG: carboxymuconolactone decarboxylase family protein [Rhodospirillales bacterium]|nr:carboxymuconolactone decarboxylase family protein [Rhodospirillales bacterium]
MSRLKELTYDELDDEQRAMYDEIVAGPRGHFVGPFHAWLRSPPLGHISQKLGAFCRFSSTIDPISLEVCILTVARHWSQPYEWAAHKKVGLKAGLNPIIIDAIENGKAPKFDDDKQAIAHEIAKELLETRTISDESYARAMHIIGEKTLVELTSVIGYYTSIALQMNCFKVVPSGDEPLLSGAIT